MRLEKLVVFRGLYLGDLVAATGALRALRHGYPGAEITLVSLPWASALAPHLPHVDRLLSYPGASGLDGGEDKGDLKGFLARVQAEKFALAVNMHGRGPISTRLVVRFSARRVAGFAHEAAPTLDVEVPWDAEAHESCKLFLLAFMAGGASAGPEPELRIRTEDDERARALLPAHLRRRPLALVHPGASVPEKCWPEEGFGRVSEGLARRGRVKLDIDRARGRVIPESSSPLVQLGLTAREQEVLILMATGATNRQIAERLFISPNTATLHVSNILSKLGVSNRVEAATIAHRLGV